MTALAVAVSLLFSIAAPFLALAVDSTYPIVLAFVMTTGAVVRLFRN